MTINIIVAFNSQLVIGKDNQLPWYLPADLRYFKKMTEGHAVLMGRKTFASLGRPLPNRKNLVVSRKAHQSSEDVFYFQSIQEAVQFGKREHCDHLFVIGGGEIYRQALHLADYLYVTEVDVLVSEPTVFFPEWNKSEWILEETMEGVVDEKNLYNHRFLRYKKIK